MRKYGLPYQEKPLRPHRDLEDTESERREWALQIAYTKRVESIIKAADEQGGKDYRGITIRAIHEAMGEDADRERTGRALSWLTLHYAGLVPERFSLKPPAVRYVDQHLWGKPVVVAKSYKFDARCFPERSVYGAREK